MKLIVSNKKVSHNYEIIQKYISGIILYGYEVKSVKSGSISLSESFITLREEELFILHMYIAPIAEIKNMERYNSLRERKLLLNKNEINEIGKYLKQSGYTIVPLSVFLKNGLIKLNIAVVKGLKQYDKREKEKKRSHEMDIERSQNIKYKL